MSMLASRIGAEIKGLIRPEHPGLARAWVSFGYVGSSIDQFSSHNVAGVTRLAKGRYRIDFATAFADANYCWVASARSSSTSTIRFAAVRTTADAKTADYLELVCTSSSGWLADTTELNLVVYR